MKAVRTLRLGLKIAPYTLACFGETHKLFNFLVAIYLAILDQRPELAELSSRAAADALERLTHRTTRNHDPPMHCALAQGTPSDFRRSAAASAIGIYKAFRSHLANWRKRKEQAAAAGRKFEERPPKLPREISMSPTLYKRMYKDFDGKSILIKLYDGEGTWRWVKVELSGRPVPDGWTVASPRLVRRRQRRWELHVSVTKDIPKLKSVEALMQEATRICSVDLNISEHLAVCTILTLDGECVATKFIRGGQDLNHRRRRQLGRIYRRMSDTGVVGKDEQHCRRRWDKVQNINRNEAHRVSRRIVEFALQHGASIIVFENLKNFRPRKTDVNGQGKRRSSRANLKRSLWLRGMVQQFTGYKGQEFGIVVRTVPAYYTSRRCSGCGQPVIRYDENEPPEGYTEGAPLTYCLGCGKRDNADRNAALNIGRKFLKQHRKALIGTP